MLYGMVYSLYTPMKCANDWSPHIVNFGWPRIVKLFKYFKRCFVGAFSLKCKHTKTNAFLVGVHALETLQADGDEKAGQYLAAILRFEFIIALLVAVNILNSTVPLTYLLQKQDNDVLHDMCETRVVINLCNDERLTSSILMELYNTLNRGLGCCIRQGRRC